MPAETILVVTAVFAVFAFFVGVVVFVDRTSGGN